MLRFSFKKSMKLVVGLIVLYLGSLQAGHGAGTDFLYCLYEKPKFNDQKLCGSRAEVNWLGWHWHARASSIRVKENFEVIAYEYPFQLGSSKVFDGNVANFVSNNS